MALHVNPSGVLSVVCKNTRELIHGLPPLNVAVVYVNDEMKVAQVNKFWIPVLVDTDEAFELHGGVTYHEFEPSVGDLVGGGADEPGAGGDGDRG